MKLNYVTLKKDEGDKFTYKQELERSSFDVLKDEVDGVLDVRVIDELDIWFDDEFLLKDETPIPSVIIKNKPTASLTDYDIVICGNVVFTSHDEEGNTVSLTQDAYRTLEQFKPAFLGEHLVWVYENF